MDSETFRMAVPVFQDAFFKPLLWQDPTEKKYKHPTFFEERQLK